MSIGLWVMETALRDRMGFLTADQVQAIAGDPVTRLEGLLVRCGGGRFLAPAQDVQHFIGIIERDKERARARGLDWDYVRDVSVPAGWTRTRGGLSFDPLKGR